MLLLPRPTGSEEKNPHHKRNVVVFTTLESSTSSANAITAAGA
jgi:hypothetical protein